MKQAQATRIVIVQYPPGALDLDIKLSISDRCVERDLADEEDDDGSKSDYGVRNSNLKMKLAHKISRS
jgi:hypothetical protein